jgi:hypothetical protein
MPHREKNLSLIQQTGLTDEIELFRVRLRRYIQAETVALDQMDYDAKYLFLLCSSETNRLLCFPSGRGDTYLTAQAQPIDRLEA